MNIYIAGNNNCIWEETGFYAFNRLESIQYLADTEKINIPKYKSFMLDSGAFTYIGKTKRNVDFNSYAETYAGVIKETGVDLFFELDVDNVIGYDEVKKLTQRIETITGKQPIPVWHIKRGIDCFNGLCKDYKYVAIGGIVTREIKQGQYKYFPYFIDKAHEHGAKIHGLGFTNTKLLPKYRFDSVDSSTWLNGNRFGHLHYFEDNIIKTKKEKKEGKFLNYKSGRVHNFIEWCKYAHYAQENL